MSDLKRIQIRKDVKIRIWIRYYLKLGSGSVIDWKVGSKSGSVINSFGSATLLVRTTKYPNTAHERKRKKRC